jgi:hypothetical protein
LWWGYVRLLIAKHGEIAVTTLAPREIRVFVNLPSKATVFAYKYLVGGAANMRIRMKNTV